MVGDSYSDFGRNFFLEEEFMQDLLGARGDRGGVSLGGGVASGNPSPPPPQEAQHGNLFYCV